MSRWPAMLLLISAVMLSGQPPHANHTSSFNFDKPVTQLARYDFTQGETLGIVSGTWATSGGTFNSLSTATAIATIDFYEPELLDFPADPAIDAEKFWYGARMLNQRSGSATRVGIVYLYQDPSNFYEAAFSPTGSVFVREVTNGVATTVATGTYSGGGQNKWFDAEVKWTAAETVIRVNGLLVVRGIKQNARTSGRVGVITRQTTAKFDRLLATREYGDPEFRRSFSGGNPGWNELQGNWSVVNGAYQNSAVEHASVTLLPINVGFDFPRDTERFLVEARMLNPYGASGNRMGFLFGYQGGAGGGSYQEIVFGGDGIARANFVSTTFGPGGNTTRTPQATAPYPGRAGQWFDVSFAGDAEGTSVSVSVDGTPVFTGLSMVNFGPLGLVTHWTPGRFDDVWFSHGGRLSAIERFDSFENRVWFSKSGTWDTTGVELNNRSAGVSDLVYTYWQRSTDYTVSARMLNQYGTSGNRIGLIFGFDFEAGDYYEVLFAPTGQAYFNKFIQGQLTQVATATHSALGSNVWFTVTLARRGTFATVKVNGQTVFQNIPAAQLDNSINSGRIGVISHWARARFDDLRIDQFAPR